MIAQPPGKVEESAKLRCVSCGADNVDRGGFCFRCMTPLELSRSVAARGTPARFVSVLGASAAGKTVYLGFLLDVLSKGSRNLRGIPNGSFSVAMQQLTMSALQHRRFPEKTPSEADSFRWVHCEVAHGKRQNNHLDIITPDFAGEAIAIEVEQPGTYETIRSAVSNSAALMILIDSLRARDAGRDEDFFAMKLASYIHSLHSQGGSKRKRLTLPIAIVFTKADSCTEAMHNPSEFASSNLPGLVNCCERNFRHYNFFASGVVGSCATYVSEHGVQIRIPLHIEPHGIIEPLEWITKRL